MADAPRPAPPDLTGLSPGIEAFELMRRLEGAGLRFGHAGGPAREPARLGQGVRLGPPAREVAGWQPAGGGGPARVTLEIAGLFGPEGPMPLHLSRRILERMSERWFGAGGGAEPGTDRSFLEFCDLLQHRMAALYYRAFAEAQPAVAADHAAGPEDGGGRLAAMLAALAGCGLPGVAAALDDPELILRHATALAAGTRGPEPLEAVLADLLGAPVRLREFVPHWQAIPAALATRPGIGHARLGQGAMIGPRIYQPQARAEIVVGPLDLPRYRALMGEGAPRAALRRLLRFVMGDEIGFDLRLVLAADAVPAPRLGRAMVLGRIGWLGCGTGDRGDLVQPLDERRAA